MTSKPRRPLGEKDITVEVDEKLVAVRTQTLALSAFVDATGVLPTELLGFEPVKGNTTFEKITCVGLTPSLDQLTATVAINANSGYSGPLCASGSTEYVRFYVSTDDGATWVDAGADSFAVHDTPGPRPLVHAVNVVTPMRHTLCWIENHPLVRAILSWNVPPPAGQPDWPPPWGNVLDVRVRPRSRRFPKIWELVEIGAIKLPDLVADVIDPQSELKTVVQPSPAPEVLAKEYVENDVPAARFVFPAYLKATATGLGDLVTSGPVVKPPRVVTTKKGKAAADALAAPVPFTGSATLGSVLDTIGVSYADFLAELLKTDGNTSYEELGCVGYDPVEDALVGVFTVKKPYGYSGSACTAGSTEYVAFWVDWGAGWQYVGTTSTVVHDEDVPKGGLRFSVYHPLASWAHRRACSDGPVQPRVRAILSWQQAPPPGNPNWVPTWGNREEARFELPAGAVTPLAPVLESITGWAVCQIDQATGLTHAHERPFGGGIGIAGFIPGAPDLGSVPMKYKLIAREIASDGTVLATEFLTSPFDVWVTESIGGAPPTQYVVHQSADATGWFTYLGDPSPTGAGWRQVVGNLLYPWSSKPRTGRWEIELLAKDSMTTYAAQVITCPDSSTRQAVRIHLDQADPVPNVEITGYHLPGQPTIPAGSCMKFPIGAVLEGTFSATDEHFDTISLSVEGAPYSPTTPGGTARWTVTGATAYPAAPTTGTSGTWEFDTAGMQACGYILRGVARDRTVNGGGGWWEDDVEGFSLE